MKRFRIAALPVVLIWFAGCSTPQERAYEAQEKVHEAQSKVHEQRLELIDDYKACLKEAGDDKPKTESCDQYLKAAEALQ